MRLGILGGVFNPPHLGHLVGAQEALVQLGLDEVLFMPVGRAPHREVESDPGPQSRLDLCRAAIDGDDRFGVSRAEVDRPGPSYTADTLGSLRADLGPDGELVLLLGADQAAELPSWHRPEEVLALAEVAVVARSERSPDNVREALAGLRGAERVRFFEMPRIDISSTLVRGRVAAGLPIRYLVRPPVESLILERGLYRDPVVAP